MSPLDTYIAALDLEQRGLLDAIRGFAIDLIDRDDELGVQKRFDPVEEAYLVCFIHEVNRARARGIAPATVYDGLIGVAAKLVRNIAINYAVQAGIDEVAAADFIADSVAVQARALATGRLPDQITGPRQMFDTAIGGLA